MLIQFTVNNFRSIKDEQSLRFQAVNKFSSKEHPENIIVPESNEYGVSAVKSMVIFGHNASGKSNMLKAIKALQYLVEKSADFKLDTKIAAYEPFKLCPVNNKQPVHFNIDFIAKNGLRYVYELEFGETVFLKEALYFYPHTPKTSKTKLFIRESGKPIKFGTYYKGGKVFEIYENQLILSQVGTRPIKSLIEPYRFLSKYLFCSTIHDTMYDDAIIQSFAKLINEKSDTSFSTNINKLLRAADTGITGIRTKEYSEDAFRFPEEMSHEVKKELVERYKHRIKAVHAVYEEGKIAGEELFDINEESTGTIKLLVVGGLILDALQNGSVIIIDELDKSLHPKISQMLIQLFNSKENNPHNAQLIFATHDISLIDRELFRIDQFYFADKDYSGSSEYSRLSDFTNISKVAPLAKWYLLGRFTTTPMIDEYEFPLELNNTKTYERAEIH